jgi:hypothetical protein
VSAEGGGSGKAGRPPSVVLTSTANLIHLEKEIRSVAKQSFEFRSTCNGTQVTIRDMVDYMSVKSHFDNNNLAYFIFYTKSMKPIKEMIRHLLQNTLTFDLTSLQMSSNRRFPAEAPKTISLYLLNLPRTEKSQEIIKLLSLCHIANKT